MLKKTSVSVLISCCNLEKYLDECVESIYAQTLQPAEIIIVHDGCSAPPGYSNTTTVHHPENRGVARTRHEGVLLSKGDYLLFVDADDCLSENYIESMVKTALHSHADLVYPDALLWARWGNQESKHPNKWHTAPESVTHSQMYDRCEVLVSSLMKRSLYDTVGGFPHLPMLEDWMFHLQALSNGAQYVKAPTYLKYRQRMNSRNRQPEELKNQVWNEVRDRFVLQKGVLHAKKSKRN